MQEKKIKAKITWRNWLIKKLLTNETSKEDILNFIAKKKKKQYLVKPIKYLRIITKKI